MKTKLLKKLRRRFVIYERNGEYRLHDLKIKFNPSERKRIYRNAKSNYLNTHPKFRSGICAEIVGSVYHLFNKKITLKELEETFPELKTIKPYDCFKHSEYWWPLNDYKNRILAFDKLISLADKKSKIGFWDKFLEVLRKINVKL